MWSSSNGRYSISDGRITLIVPFHGGPAAVERALAYLNRAHPAPVQPKRKCAACGFALALHHKWFIRDDGLMQHRHCDDPTSY